MPAPSPLASVVGETKRALSTILERVQTLYDEDLSPKGEEALSFLNADSERLMRLLENAVDFERLEQGLLPLTEGPFSPRDVLSRVELEVSELLSRLGVNMKLVVDESIPDEVLGDADLLQRMLVEFVTNAVEFSKGGEVQVRAYRSASSSLDDIHYEIVDTGPGISGRNLALVFEPFYRATKDGTGAGLGLSICRDLVNLMGGKISLATSPTGTKVTVSLSQPAAHERDPSAFDDVPLDGRKSLRSTPLARPKVLLVEDDPANRRLLAKLIETAGYKVDVSSEGREALTMLRQTDYDILVTDIAMPKMDGIDLVATCRRDEAMSGRRRIPAVVLTAHGTPELQVRCRNAGVDVFLSKPIKGSTLRRALAKIGYGVGRVLVVDPWDESRFSMEACLDSFPLPLRIESARSQNEAIAACVREKFSIIFVQLDTGLFLADEVVDEIRSLPGFLGAACIGYGAPSSSSEGYAFSKVGFSDVIGKDIDRQTIHRLVRQHLRAASVHVRTTPSVLRSQYHAPTLLELTLPSSALKVSIAEESRDQLPEFLEGLRADLDELKLLVDGRQFSIIGAVGTNMRVSGRLHQFEEVSAIGSRLEQAAARADVDWLKQLCARLEDYLKQVQIGQV